MSQQAMDEMWMREAYRIASTASDDNSTQNGAVIVKDGRQLSFHANAFPLGITKKFERLQRPAKYQWIEHAERNAIYLAAMGGVKLLGATMYCPWSACAECGRAIIQAGIREVVTHDCELHRTRPDWEQSIAVARQMFKECGVICRSIKCEIGQEILFDGKTVSV